MVRLTVGIRVRDEISDEANLQTAVEARGLRSQIDLSFIGLTVVFRKALSETKFLSDILQSPKVDLPETFRQTFEEYHKEDTFHELWSTVIETHND